MSHEMDTMILENGGWMESSTITTTATQFTTTTTTLSSTTTATTNQEPEGWDDEGLAASLLKTKPFSSSHNNNNNNTANNTHTVELLDMNSLQLKRNDDIAERLRVEETKAQLAAAKAGMEREAARLNAPPSANVAATPTAVTTASWVAPHRRGGGTAGMSLSSSSSLRSSHGMLNTTSQELFPDLRTADAILEKQQQQQQLNQMKPMKLTSSIEGVGGGATWGGKPTTTTTRTPLNLKKATPKTTIATTKDNPIQSHVEKDMSPVKDEILPIVNEEINLEATSLTEPAAVPVPKKKPLLKKKKKDLSTFKPSTS
jgi:hypothetical protein